jgi:hypothetical protein
MHLPYAKFRLPTGGAGLPASMHKNKIAKSVREWAEPKDIEVEFETEGYTLNVRFESKDDLMMFKLSYNTETAPFCSYEIFYY